MASIIHSIKEKLSGTKAAPNNNPVGDSAAPPEQGSGEPTFRILPHPAEPSDNAGGLQGDQDTTLSDALKSAPGPVLLDQDTLDTLGAAKSPEELKVRQAELNGES